MNVVLLAVALSLSAAANAQGGGTSSQSELTKPIKEKKVCRRETSTGSIMPSSTCHTAAQWAAIDSANGADLERQRDQSVGQHGLGR